MSTRWAYKDEATLQSGFPTLHWTPGELCPAGNLAANVPTRTKTFRLDLPAGITLTIDRTNVEEAARELTALVGPPQVFLTYAAADGDIARTVAQDLGKQDIRVWLDEEEIRVGDNIRKKVEEGLRSSGYVLAFLSANYLNSESSRKELSLALPPATRTGVGRPLFLYALTMHPYPQRWRTSSIWTCVRAMLMHLSN